MPTDLGWWKLATINFLLRTTHNTPAFQSLTVALLAIRKGYACNKAGHGLSVVHSSFGQISAISADLILIVLTLPVPFWHSIAQLPSSKLIFGG